MERTPLVSMRGITKVYPDGVKALDGVDFDLYPGEVHSLLGENGAGKTTLMRILYGEIRPTSGRILVEGREVRWRGPWDAIRAGIAMVYQHFRLVETLTVEENLLIYLSSLGLGRAEARRRIGEAMERLGLEVPLDAVVGDLPMGVRQRVEILKAISGGARVLILDEPTSNLTPLEVEALFGVIERLKSMGVSVVYITHKLWEVTRISDRITVLRRGRVVATLRNEGVSEEELARLMVGELAEQAASGRRGRPGRPALVVRNLRVVVGGVERVKGVSLTVREGEILGVAGVAGNGQEELVAAILGLLKPVEGEVLLWGRPVRSPRDFYRLGGGVIPGDRSQVLAAEMSVGENAAFIYYTGSNKLPLTPGEMARLYEEIRDRFQLVAPGPWAPVGRLSGGNQQKVVVGSEVLRGPRMLVAVNPTQGLDVATTRFVRRLLSDLASRGVAVLLVSADLDEVLELSDRVVVMSGGRVTGELARGEATPEKVGVLMGA